MQWKDETSYSRGQRGTIEPYSWECRAGSLRITVTRYHGYGDVWLLCTPLPGCDMRRLQSHDIADAQVEALELVRETLREMLDALG